MTHPDLTRLARELESSDPYDPSAQACNLGRLREIRDQIRRNDELKLATCLGSVVQLIEALTGSRETIGREQVKGIACRMLFALGSDLGDLPVYEDEAPAPAPRQSRPVVAEAPAEAKAPTEAEAPAPPRIVPPPRPAKSHVPQQPRRADMTFGRMLVELGQVTRDQIAQALRFHRAKGPRIGECLLLQGAISPEHLLNALKIQDLLRTTPQGITPETLQRYKKVDKPQAEETHTPPVEEREPLRDAPQRVTEGIFLGEVLLGAEMITNHQLEKALHLHYRTGIQVGEALIQLGVLTEKDLQGGLELQKQLRRIAGINAA